VYIYGIGMYVEVGIDVVRAGDKVLPVSTPVWGGGEVVTYLYNSKVE
jgi:hypothetical protein